MLGISFEHVIILLVILLIFGPRRLPELGNTLGKAIKNFKDSISGVEEAKFRKITENEQKIETQPSSSSASVDSTSTS